MRVARSSESRTSVPLATRPSSIASAMASAGKVPFATSAPALSIVSRSSRTFPGPAETEHHTCGVCFKPFAPQLGEVPRGGHDVFPPIGQSRQGDDDACYPLKEIPSKATAREHAFEVILRRAQDAEINPLLGDAPERLQFLRLQDA